MGWTSTLTNQYVEVTRLFMRVKDASPERLVNKIHKWSTYCVRSWEKNVNNMINSHDISDIIYSNYTSRYRIYHIKRRLREYDERKWSNDLFNDFNKVNGNKLRTYRIFKDRLETSSYIKLVQDRECRRILSNFRCGSLPLAVETGRFTKPYTNLHDRKCIYCKLDKVEDEKHFLLECDFYSDLRDDFYAHILNIYPTFCSFNQDEKLHFLMNSDFIQKKLSIFIIQIYKRRKCTVGA